MFGIFWTICFKIDFLNLSRLFGEKTVEKLPRCAISNSICRDLITCQWPPFSVFLYFDNFQLQVQQVTLSMTECHCWKTLP